MPVALIVIVVLAVVAELWLRTTTSGLRWRAAGLDEESSHRTGLPVQRVKVSAYVLCSLCAAVAGLLLAVQVGVGDNSVGASYALPSFTACFLGGAALTGGRGSFIGVMIGALFLSVLTNIPTLINVPTATTQVASGVLTIAAVIAYAYSERTNLKTLGSSRRRSAVAPGAGPEMSVESSLIRSQPTESQVDG
jgi:ribose transport system ATP-binding protein